VALSLCATVRATEQTETRAIAIIRAQATSLVPLMFRRYSFETGKNAMNNLSLATLVLCTPLIAMPLSTQAQPAAQATPAPLSRMQVKMERDEWFKTHHWEEITEQWVLNRDVEPPMGVKSRIEVKAQRNAFLQNNRWDESRGGWIPLNNAPRSLSKMSRKQIRDETRQFVRTHHFDEPTGLWVDTSKRTATK
jgi:hypothetical protein